MKRAAPTPASPPWVYGPAIDLLLGCGVGYLLLAGVVGLLPFAADDVFRVGVLGTFVTGMPHYGATLVRVYEDAADRRKYAFFTVWASLVIWSVFALGTAAPVVGSILLTVYVTWSPWHYSGQNYGLAVMFLRRRGVAVDPRSKRALYASFVLSYALVFSNLHAGFESSGYVPAELAGSAYRVLALGIPGVVHRWVFGVLLVAHVAATLVAILLLLRRAAFATLLPALLLVSTQALWFTVPNVVLWIRGTGFRGEHIAFYFLWVGIAHSIQYLWITTWYAAGKRPLAAKSRYWSKALVAGGLVFGLPALVFAPGWLGTVPYQSGLWLLVASAVNLQHFVLDGAIWKLRDGPVARALLASGPVANPVAAATPANPWAARTVWALAAGCTALSIGAAVEYEYGWLAAVERGDVARAERAETRLAAIGRDNPYFYERRAQQDAQRGALRAAIDEYRASLAFYPTYEAWYAIGVLYNRTGDSDAAASAFESSLAIYENAPSWGALGGVREAQGRREEALEAYTRSLAIDPDYVPALHHAGRFWLDQGERDRARDLLRRAASIEPGNPLLAADLRRAGG